MGLTIASDVLDEARSVYLNDPSANEATDVLLLKHLKVAHDLLQCELEANGVQTVNEESFLIIKSGYTEYDPLPADLSMPKQIYERTPNTTEEWKSLTYKNNLPVETPGPFLQFWSYRVDRIYFLPSTVDREVKLLYQKAYPVPKTTDAVLIGKAETYLAAKTAALYQMFVRQNPTLAEQANNVAEAKLADIINQQVQLMQAAPVRRKGYMPYRNS